MEPEGDGETICNWCIWISFSKTRKRDKGIRNQRTNPGHSIVKIARIVMDTIEDLLSLGFEWCEKLIKSIEGNPRRVVANVLNCKIIVSEFELKSRYKVHFRNNSLGKTINPFCC